MTENRETTEERRAVEASAMIRGKIMALRARHVAVGVVTGVALAVTVAVELLALVMFLDWWLDLPWGVRCLLLGGQVMAAGFIVVKFVLLPVMRQPDDDELALMVERARPEFRTRLIAAVQLTRPDLESRGVSRSLVGATVAEAEAMARPVDFAGVVSSTRMKKLAGVAVAVVALGLLGMGFGGGVTFDLLQRAFLSTVPVPRKTRVLVPNGDQTIGRGDMVLLEAYAEGIVPGAGELAVRYAGRRDQRFVMDADPNNRARFIRRIESVQESFNYLVRLNDGRSRVFVVRVIPRPAVASIECEQQFPSYTRLAPVRRPLGDLSLLAGSRLRLRVTATKPISSAGLRVVGTNVSDVVLAVGGEDRRELTGELLIPGGGLSGFAVEMTDEEGMASVESAVYRVEIVPDRAPVVRITAPLRKEELLTREAVFPIGMDVVDDFQVADVLIHYKADVIDEGRERTIELDLSEGRSERVLRQFFWRLAEFDPRLPEGTLIEYWIEARDNNDVTGPGVGRSDHQLARIVSRDEKRAELLNRAGDAFASIDEAASDQEALSRSLGEMILEKRGRRP